MNLSLAATAASPVGQADPPQAPGISGELLYHEADGQVLYDEDSGMSTFISPRLKYLDTVGASIKVRSGIATCNGTVFIYVDNDVTITVQLQRSTDGDSWSNVSGERWTGRLDGPGSKIVEGKSGALARGYQYRARVTATALSASGTPLETVVVASGVEYYL